MNYSALQLRSSLSCVLRLLLPITTDTYWVYVAASVADSKELIACVYLAQNHSVDGHYAFFQYILLAFSHRKITFG